MRVFYMLLFLLLTGGFAATLQAQQPLPRFEHLTVDDGLSMGDVYAMMQDQYGYLWFGSYDGLNKYDGYSFTPYKYDPFDSTSLSGNIIRALEEGQDGTLWVGTHTGLNQFDPLTGQAIRYLHDPNDPGSLSNDEVRYVHEDGGGRVWVLTIDPTERFMGMRLDRVDPKTRAVTRYRHDPDDSQSLGHDTVIFYALSRETHVGLYETRDGEIWVSTLGGVNRYDPESDGFIRYEHDPNDASSFSHEEAWSYSEDRNGTLWIGTLGGGLNRFDAATETFTHFRHDPNDPNSLSHDEIYALFLDRAGNLWIGTNSGVDVLDPDSGTFLRHYRHDPENPTTTTPAQRRGWYPSLLHNRHQQKEGAAIQPFFEDAKGRIWFKGLNTGEFVYRYDPQTETFTHIAHDPFDPTSLSTEEIWVGMGERMGSLWISTKRSTGLNYTDLQRGSVEHFAHDPENPNSLDMHLVWSIYSDSNDNLWVSTYRALNRFDRASQTVTHFLLNGWHVAFMHEDSQGDFWVLRSDEYDSEFQKGALNKWDRETNTFTPYSHVPTNPTSLSHDEVPFYIGIKVQPAFLEAQDGSIWVGTNGGGLNRYDRATDSFVHYRHDPEDLLSLSSDTVAVLYEDGSGTIWVGTANRTEEGGRGLNQFDKEAGTFTRFLHDPTDPESLSGNEVTSLLEDRQGRLWVGTATGGLNRLDRETKTFTHYAPLPEEPDAIRPAFVRLILEDHTGKLWMQTEWGGLTRFDPTTGTFTPFTEQNSELPSNDVNNLIADDNGNLWITTNGSGIARFDPQSDEFRVYDTSRGFQSMEFNRGAVYKSASGELFFGGINGFNAFYPEQLTDNEIPPEVVLTGLRLFDEPVDMDEEGPLKEHISIAEEITLGHNQNDLTIEYVGLHYSNPEANQYAYKLEPYEDDWRYVGTQRTAIYPNVPPGDYTFRVKAANADGYWSDGTTAISVTVYPPWWRTTWAYALYGLLFVVGVITADRVQRRRLIRRERQRAEIEQAELRERAAKAVAEIASSEARALKAENDRKEVELEKARELGIAYNELKKTQDQLILSEKMASLGALTAGIAHEIKNPLNFVNNFAQINQELADELTRAIEIGESNDELLAILEDLKQGAEVINKQGKRADAIVKSMMEHASGGSGQREPTDVNALVEEYFNLAYHGMRAKDPAFKVKLERLYGETVGDVEVVPQEMGRVLINLMNNAFYAVQEKASKTNGDYVPTVRVVTEQRGGGVVIQVKDNGGGISVQDRAKIFEPFYTTKPTGQGNTGLGLSLSYDIVTQGHGGTLTVESEEGEGATFIISLPT